MKLSSAVKLRRLSLGMTQGQVAEKAGVTPGTYSRVENDKAVAGWRPSTLNRVATALDLPPALLGMIQVNGDGEDEWQDYARDQLIDILIGKS